MFCFSIILPITLVEKDKMNLETFDKQGVEDDRDARTKRSFQQNATHTRIRMAGTQVEESTLE